MFSCYYTLCYVLFFQLQTLYFWSIFKVRTLKIDQLLFSVIVCGDVYTLNDYGITQLRITPTFGYRGVDNTADDRQLNERVEKHRRGDCGSWTATSCRRDSRL